MTTRRKIAIATWSSPKEGNIYGKMTVDATNLLRYCQEMTEKTGEKITVTHVVGKIVGLGLKEAPDINGRIAYGKYIPHKTADLSFLIAIPHAQDLGKFKVCEIDKKSVVEIAQELKEAANKLRTGKDNEFKKSQDVVKVLPTWILRPILWLTGYITGALGFGIKPLGLEAYPFGGAIITSVGMFGIDEGYPPPTPFARVPLYVVITKIKDRPVVHQNEIVIRPQLDLMITIDHRFIDGFRGGQLSKLLKHYLEDPYKMDELSASSLSQKAEASPGNPVEPQVHA